MVNFRVVYQIRNLINTLKVCKIAGLNEKLIGGKMVNKRKLVGEYHKWELVTSHICRRSYVSNFRHILGDENVMAATGHKSPKNVRYL